MDADRKLRNSDRKGVSHSTRVWNKFRFPKSVLHRRGSRRTSRDRVSDSFPRSFRRSVSSVTISSNWDASPASLWSWFKDSWLVMSMQEQILSHCNLDGILPCWVIIDEFRGLRASARLALCLLVFASIDRAQYLQYLKSYSLHMYRRFLRLTLDYMYINTRDRREYVIACLCPAQEFTLKFICENECQSDTHVAWSSRRETCEQTKGDWAHRAAQDFALNMALLSKAFGIKFTYSYFETTHASHLHCGWVHEAAGRSAERAKVCSGVHVAL